MAQVTMTSEEFLQYIDQERKYKALEREIQNSIAIVFDDEDNTEYSMKTTFVMPQAIKAYVQDNIAEQLVEHKEVMRKLVQNKRYILNVQGGHISCDYSWNSKLDPWEVNLKDNLKFKAMWDAIVQEEEEKAETEVEAEDGE